MGENDFCCHTSEYEGHGQAEKDQAVTSEKIGVGRSQPRSSSNHKDDHRRPFEKKWCQRQILGTPGASYVDDTSWKVCDEEADYKYRYPEVPERGIAQVCFKRWKVGDQGSGPNGRPVVPGEEHNGTSKDKTLCRCVSVKTPSLPKESRYGRDHVHSAYQLVH